MFMEPRTDLVVCVHAHLVCVGLSTHADKKRGNAAYSSSVAQRLAFLPEQHSIYSWHEAPLARGQNGREKTL